jgi:hypothetical protein
MVLSNTMNSFTADADQPKFFWVPCVSFQNIDAVSAPITQPDVVSVPQTAPPSFYTGSRPQADGSFLLHNGTIG